MDTSERKGIAKRLLTHYFQTAFQGAGLRWDNDNRVEVEEIIDLIFAEINDQAEAVDERRERLGRIRGAW